MENLLTFVSIIIIVFGILQIILFFKVWGMTNRVVSIDDKLKNQKHDYEFYMLIGEKEKAYHTLIENLVIRLLVLRSETYGDEGFIKLANSEIPYYVNLIKNIDFEAPDYLLSAEAFLKYRSEIRKNNCNQCTPT